MFWHTYASMKSSSQLRWWTYASPQKASLCRVVIPVSLSFSSFLSLFQWWMCCHYTFSRILCKWILQHIVFFAWLLSLSIIIGRVTHTVAYINNSFLLILGSILLYGCITIYLFIYLSMDIWVIFSFWLLQVKLLWTFMDKCLHMDKCFHFSWVNI